MRISSLKRGVGVDRKVWCLSPSGYRRREHVVRLPSGHSASQTPEGLWEVRNPAARTSLVEIRRQVFEEPAPVVLGGESAWASWGLLANGGPRPFTLGQATWVVPPLPSTNAGQTIYLFNGLQHLDVNDDSYILQPVLTYGEYPRGSDEDASTNGGWMAGSFLVPSPHAKDPTLFVSDQMVAVKPGDVLTGRMTLESWDPLTRRCKYLCEFVGLAGTQLHIETPFLEQCVVSLELWNLTDTNEMPAGGTSTAFRLLATAVDGHDVAGGWQPQGLWSAVVKDAAEVDVTYPT